MRLQTFPGKILHMALIRSLLVTPVDWISIWQAFLMAHYFQGGYQSRAQRLRICIEAASILHAACAASCCIRHRTGMRLRTGLILMSYSKAHAAHMLYMLSGLQLEIASSCHCCAFVRVCFEAPQVCSGLISTLTVQICDRLCEYYPGQHLQRRSPQKNPSHRDVAAKRRSFLRTLHDSS